MGSEARTALRFAGVGLIGFALDAALLRLGLRLGLSPAVARAVSLGLAMQATFAINGLVVFRCLAVRKLVRQWAGYMAANGFGNLCNYWIFVTLVSSHWPVIANPYIALVAGSITAYGINYAATRLLVFGKAGASEAAARREDTCAATAPADSKSGDSNPGDVAVDQSDGGHFARRGLAGPGLFETASG